MVFQECPVCQHVNDALALRCAACHSDLRDADTVPAALITLPTAPQAAGALWLDDLGPRLPAEQRPTEPLPVLTLRDVVAPTTPAASPKPRRDLAPAPAAAPTYPVPPLQGAFPPLPTLPELPELDWAVPAPQSPESPASAPSPTPRPAESPRLTPPLPTPLTSELHHTALDGVGKADALPIDADPGHAARAAAREARRAAVRRARLRQAAAALGDTVPEVLVLDHDGAARDLLCNLLRSFGFGVHSLADVRRAMELRAVRHFVAAFVDIRLDAADGGLGIDLCHQWHDAGDTVLVLVAAPLSPIGRVRAEMLGFAAILAKPVSRGDVARVLDANGVALPSDARRI